MTDTAEPVDDRDVDNDLVAVIPHDDVPSPRRALSTVVQLLKFGAVGGIGFVVNLVVFNALLLTVFAPSRIAHGPILATIGATLVAIVANWVGNRYWAFADRRQSNTAREGLEFLTASIVGMAVPLACVWVSHYLLGFTSIVADNIANNVVGLLLGMLLRYALYRWWVFAPKRDNESRGRARAAATSPIGAESSVGRVVPPTDGLIEG